MKATRRAADSSQIDTSTSAVPLSAHAVLQPGGVGALRLGDVMVGVERPARPAREALSARPAIISCLSDVANVLTLAGLGCSGAAIVAVMGGSFHLAGLLMVGAYLADLFDGPVARRTRQRAKGLNQFGARLDSLADLVGCGVSPSVAMIAYAGPNPWVVAAAAGLLGAAAVRLAYFDTYGLDESGGYTGVPTDFVILFFSGLLVLEGWVGASVLAGLLVIAAVASAALMVSPARVPKLKGAWYFYLSAVALVIIFGHAVSLAI